jgi:hypothetical protein
MFGESEREATAHGSEGRNTFVVRIWSSDGSDVMQGHVQHVRSRKRAYFANRQRLLTFIQDHLQDSGQDRCRS